MAGTLEVTYMQLEAKLSQKIAAMYLTYLGHEPDQVSCRLVEQTIDINIQGSITKPEQLLLQQGKWQLANQVRSNIQTALQPQLRSLVEETFAVPTLEILGDSHSDPDSTSVVVILSRLPSITDLAAVAPTTKPRLEVGRDDDK